jgi:hypothetical protein
MQTVTERVFRHVRNNLNHLRLVHYLRVLMKVSKSSGIFPLHIFNLGYVLGCIDCSFGDFVFVSRD